MANLLEICDTGIKEAAKRGASETEVYAASIKVIEVNLEKNDIQLATSQISDGIGIRVFKNKSLGFASITDLKDIKKASEIAVELAKCSPWDKYNELPEPVALPQVEKIYDPKVRNFSIDNALKHAVTMLEEAKNYDSRVTIDRGSFVALVNQHAIMNSKGVQAKEISSSFQYMIMGMAVAGKEVSSFTYEFDVTRFLDEVDVKKVARGFARKAIESLGAGKGKSFKGTVLLSPECVTDLLAASILSSVNARVIQKGMSRWAGKIGQQVASKILTVEDNGLLPGGLGTAAFDREGMPHKPLTIISDGTLQSYMYNTYTALKDNRNTTGHAAGGTKKVPAIGPTNFDIKAGDVTTEQLIENMKQGVIVNRFAGFPNAVTGEFSGVVKGGWLIENGKRVKPICETLIQGNIYNLLTQISGISKERKRVSNFLLPWICIANVNITAG